MEIERELGGMGKVESPELLTIPNGVNLQHSHPTMYRPIQPS